MTPLAPGLGRRQPPIDHELTETLLGFVETPRNSSHPNTATAILSGSPRPGTIWEVEAVAVEVGCLADPSTNPQQGSVLMVDTLDYAVAIARNGARIGQVSPTEKLVWPGFVSPPNVTQVRGEVNLASPATIHPRDQLTGTITSSDTSSAAGAGGFSVGPALVGFRFVFSGRIRSGAR